MRNSKMYRVVTIITLIFMFCNLSEAKLGKKLSSAVIVGTVYCDTCFQAELSKPTHLIAGALVGVECKASRWNPSFQKQVKTSANGKFIIHLPFSISKHVNELKSCSVKLIKSSEPYCAIASSATPSSLRLKAKNTKMHIFSAGYFTFKPSSQPNLCNQKPTNNFNSGMFVPSIPTDPPPVQNPLIPNLPPTDQGFLPPLPTLPRLPPLPQLPPLPTLPRLPLLPPADKNMVKSKTKNNLENLEFLIFPPKDDKLVKPKIKNDFENTEFSKTKNDLEKMKVPILPTEDKKLAKQKTENDVEKMEFPKTEHDLEKKEFSNNQELTPNLQQPIFSSPPPFGFQFPPFLFTPPSLNLPQNPFQVSPPVGNIGNVPSLNAPPALPLLSPPALTNPLPPFPFQPSPGLPGFPPATTQN